MCPRRRGSDIRTYQAPMKWASSDVPGSLVAASYRIAKLFLSLEHYSLKALKLGHPNSMITIPYCSNYYVAPPLQQ